MPLDICQEPDRHISSPLNRHHNNSYLHQQLGWICFRKAYNPCKEPVDVVSGEKHIHYVLASPRSVEPNFRLRIKNNDRLNRLAIEPCNIQTDQSTLQSLEVDFLASRPLHRSKFFHLVATPYVSATDAFLQNWSLGKLYANRPWCLIGQLLALSQTQEYSWC